MFLTSLFCTLESLLLKCIAFSYHIFFISLLDSEVLLILHCWPCLTFTSLFLMASMILLPASCLRLPLISSCVDSTSLGLSTFFFLPSFSYPPQHMSEIFPRVYHSLTVRIQFVDSINKMKQMKVIFIYPELC